MQNNYQATIGIECHVQLKTDTKLFAAVSNDARSADPNTLVSHICFGLPGALPVLNQEAINRSMRAAFALGTRPQPFSKFDRKHYFYPDLPKGYQITQFDEPIILGGQVELVLPSGQSKVVRITRAHIEEDAGKSTHPTGKDYSLVDLNRAGTPLLEIVSEPDMHSPEEAKAFARELYLLMKFADVSEADLYHGNMRFDVNVSVSQDPNQLGTRTETKNLNSFRSVEKAVAYEIDRQVKLLEKGQAVIQETRGWDEDRQKTFSQRSKEEAFDYRYFPEPDVPPIELTPDQIAQVESDIPILPAVWREKLSGVGLDGAQIETLLDAEVELEGNFLSLIQSFIDDKSRAKTFANWITNIEVPYLRENQPAGRVKMLDPSQRQALYQATFDLVQANKLSSTNAKALIQAVCDKGQTPSDVESFAQDQGYIQVSDEAEIAAIVTEVLTQNPAAANDVKNGEMKAIGFLVGQVMKASKGKANPQLAQKLIRQQLGV